MRIFIILAALLFQLYALTTHASESLNTLNKDYTLKIGTMNLAPYGWKEVNGDNKGIIYELNQAIGQRLNIPFTHNIYPFKRMLKLLNKGEIDLISSQAHQDALAAGEKLGIQFNINVIAGTKKESNIKSIADFKNKHLIFHNSASYKELEGLPRAITRVHSYKQALALLVQNRRLDGAVFSEPAYYYWMKDLGLNPNDFGNVIMIEPAKKQWIFVRRDLPEVLKAKIKRVVDEIYQENLYDELLTKYGKDKY